MRLELLRTLTTYNQNQHNRKAGSNQNTYLVFEAYVLSFISCDMPKTHSKNVPFIVYHEMTDQQVLKKLPSTIYYPFPSSFPQNKYSPTHIPPALLFLQSVLKLGQPHTNQQISTDLSPILFLLLFVFIFDIPLPVTVSCHSGPRHPRHARPL